MKNYQPFSLFFPPFYSSLLFSFISLLPQPRKEGHMPVHSSIPDPFPIPPSLLAILLRRRSRRLCFSHFLSLFSFLVTSLFAFFGGLSLPTPLAYLFPHRHYYKRTSPSPPLSVFCTTPAAGPHCAAHALRHGFLFAFIVLFFW